MFNELKAVGLEEAINELEDMFADFSTRADIQKELGEDSTYATNVSIGIRMAINVVRDVKEECVGRRY